MYVIIFIFILLGVLALAGIMIYNRLVTHKNMVQERWSDINVEWKRRYDLIPNLIESVKGYMGHEKEVLEGVTTLRTQTTKSQNSKERAKVERLLTLALSNIFAVAENYPDLKASHNFTQLQATLSEAENRIQLAWQNYNETARNFNIMIEFFPSNLIANALKLKKVDFF